MYDYIKGKDNLSDCTLARVTEPSEPHNIRYCEFKYRNQASIHNHLDPNLLNLKFTNGLVRSLPYEAQQASSEHMLVVYPPEGPRPQVASNPTSVPFLPQNLVG